MLTPHEISLLLGLLVSVLFYWKIKQYEVEAHKEELLNTFLENTFPPGTSNAI